jgi:hypothetical protein
LDKQRNHRRDNLLNIQKTANIPVKNLCGGKLSANLKGKMAFCCVHVFKARKSGFLENQIFHIHLKPSVNEKRVEGEV